MKYVVQNDGSRRVVQNVIDMLAKDKAWEVEIKPWVPRRSRPQNDLYWAIVGRICEMTGHTKDEVHNILKVKFLPSRTVNLFGVEVQCVPNSHDKNQKEFSDYIERVTAWAADELGIVIH